MSKVSIINLTKNEDLNIMKTLMLKWPLKKLKYFRPCAHFNTEIIFDLYLVQNSLISPISLEWNQTYMALHHLVLTTFQIAFATKPLSPSASITAAEGGILLSSGLCTSFLSSSKALHADMHRTPSLPRLAISLGSPLGKGLVCL